ncbi:hypothetical protein [Cellulomonas sp. URHE0023]|uniref:restriction system modified-DNA reader domain-containing protein n=1 Tax=Cellulomonas sp. URHE0023 TaxID=1380354 RepID=UPI00048785CF|nr:hypothetical protein [Cellulomonas sp. URHE0023]
MPIFELDEGRPRLVQPMQPLAGSFAQETAALLTDHLAAIAGEPLFAVRSRTSSPDHADLPALLALDATGRAVVLDVVQVVDDDAIVSSLRHAGAAARMTTTDLARAYHPDPSRFAVDFAAFREQAAYGAQSTRREGVRLIVLCSEVAAEAGDTLSFLRGPGRHVDVLQVGVVRGEDERRLLDVSPLATHEGGRRSVEPTALRLVRASEGFAGPAASAPRKPSSGELRSVAPPPPAPSNLTEPTPIVRRAVPVEAPADDPTLTQRTGRDEAPRAKDPVPSPQPVWKYEPERIAPQAPRTQETARSTHEAPTTLTPVVGLRAAQQQRPPRDRATADHVPAESASWDLSNDVPGPRPFLTEHSSNHADAPANDQVTRSAQPTETSDVAEASDLEQEVEQGLPELDRSAPGTQPLRPTRPVTRPSTLPVEHYGGPERFSAAGLPLALPELATLAKSRRAVTTLVWVRARRGQRIEAMLRSDGLIELPTGEVYSDPDTAASVAVASENAVDGWRAWRLGEGGPTLAEATGVIHP